VVPELAGIGATPAARASFAGAAGVLPHVGRLPDDLTADMAMSALRRFARVERQQEQQTAGQSAA
jgi:hypothetical protein